ncbi:MAG TPA: iron uptake transporter deferrochelatase/peroxidase subunit [Roseiarcus sp.]|nr:iron uptake transporter deferrochelatase/peroxidase subunit [Roseiarcus sp.]
MRGGDGDKSRATRRDFLGATAGMAAAAGSSFALPARALDAGSAATTEPFFGAHQSGIVTSPQTHTYFAAYDLKADKREDVVKTFRRWTEAAALLTEGLPVDLRAEGQYQETPDPADALGLSPSRLTLTFGFGPGLFVKDGRDRYGLLARRPEAFVDLPQFSNDQLAPARTGGDLSIQACADNPQVAFHAIRQLSRIAIDLAEIRWAQTGFISDYGQGKTPRNLMGFKDGTGNPSTDSAYEMDAVVWAGEEAPAWMRGGSYLVVRRARMALEHWDLTKVSEQEKAFGRKKLTGAPLGADHEYDVINLAATDRNGDPVIPENSHIRLAHEAAMAGSRVLRRSYSYNDGANVTTEPWPPYREGMEFDAGLLFMCYQRDTRNGFIKIFDKLSRLDKMNQFVSHTGGGHFACPGGIAKGEYVGQRLFEA